MEFVAKQTAYEALSGFKTKVLNLSASEADLIKRCQKDDQNAWRLIIEQYQNVVYRLAYRLVANRDDALEISQETFIAAYRGIKNFRGQSSFKTWLTKIAVRQAQKSLNYRRRTAMPVAVEEIENIQDKRDATSIDFDLRDSINKALTNMSPRMRTVVVLREIEGLGYREIAETLDISIGTVESRLHRGRACLRQILKDSDSYV